MFDMPLNLTSENSTEPAKVKSSFVRRTLTAVDFVRQHTALQVEGMVTNQLHNTEVFLTQIEAMLGIGLTVNTQLGQIVVTREDFKEGIGEERYEELVKLAIQFRSILVEVGYIPITSQSSIMVGSPEAVYYGQQAETDVPGFGKSKSVALTPAKVPAEFSTEPPTKKK